MALRIANNIAALNTQRWLSVSDAGMKKSLERLSSGYRINKAADDAAGLAISSAFRADIASFKVASRNTSEAAALLQVAEGGMDQIGNMLTRLKELATQAASANVGQTERDKINAEADKLISEIDRIANSTQYGSTALINGAFGEMSAGAMSGSQLTNALITYNSMYYEYDAVDIATGGALAGITVSATPDIVQDTTWTFAADGDTLTIGNGSGTNVNASMGTSQLTCTVADLGITLTFAAAKTTANIHAEEIEVEAVGMASTNYVSLGASAAAGTYTITDDGTDITLTDGTTTQALGVSAGAQTLDFNQLNIKLNLSGDYGTGDMNNIQFTVTQGSDSTFQIGAKNNDQNRITVSMGDVRTSNLGSEGAYLSDIDLESTSGAQTALDIVDEAVSDLTGLRGDVGAYMNRLSYAAANLSTVIENVQAAESVIRDVDMAAEMTDFTKNQILLQAGTAMLAQANMAPQQVLALFG